MLNAAGTILVIKSYFSANALLLLFVNIQWNQNEKQNFTTFSE